MLAGAHKKLERRLHTEMFLLASEAQDQCKMELPHDRAGEFFPSISGTISGTMNIIINGTRCRDEEQHLKTLCSRKYQNKFVVLYYLQEKVFTWKCGCLQYTTTQNGEYICESQYTTDLKSRAG